MQEAVPILMGVFLGLLLGRAPTLSVTLLRLVLPALLVGCVVSWVGGEMTGTVLECVFYAAIDAVQALAGGVFGSMMSRADRIALLRR
jgi:hypothetical protein